MTGDFDKLLANTATSSKSSGFVKVSMRADGTSLGLPVIIVKGIEKGPTLLVDACTHGDEYEGTLALIRVIQQLTPQKLKGVFVGVPVVNFQAFEASRRGSPSDLYLQDLNRVYPGRPDGSITEKLAYTYFSEVVSKANYVISFHGGGRQLYNTERVIIQDEITESIEMAKAMGKKWDLIGTKWSLGASLMSACAKLHIPSITAELGGEINRFPESVESAIESFTSGVISVMKYLGMIEGKPERPNSWTLLDGTPPVYLRSSNAGLIAPQKACRLRQRVAKGEWLMSILDVFGNEIERIDAPHDGIIVGVPGTYAVPGNMILIIPRIRHVVE